MLDQTSEFTTPLTSGPSETPDPVETALWAALGMDEVRADMEKTALDPDGPAMMGTGATQNACYHCSNSATTAGCGTCGM